jgi:tetraacyldisaccharide 4'-kinase
MVERARPLPAWLAPLTWPAARAYGAAIAWRNARLDRGRGVQSLLVAGQRVPVISVGNLTVGGTGKSPFVAWCADVASACGAQPVVAMRGYRAASGGGAARGSDEAREYEVTAPSARVVVGARRHASLVEALASPTAEAWRRRAAVILDDGFQHRQLARDLDIVLVDATRPGLDGDLLPNGWLREPAENIARASLVVLTKATDPVRRASAAAMVARQRGRAPDAACEHVWGSVSVHDAAGDRVEELRWLAGRRVLSACALGNPAHFHGMVAEATGVAPATLERGDHVAFMAAELDAAARRAGVDTVVMSRKDIVKLDAKPGVTLVVPDLSIAFLDGEERVRSAIAACISAAGARSSA